MFTKSKNLICGILVLVCLSSGFAQANNQKPKEPENLFVSAVKSGAEFVSNNPTLSACLPIATYLLHQRAELIEGAIYGAKIFPLHYLTLILIGQIPGLEKKIEKEIYDEKNDKELSFYESISFAAIAGIGVPIVEEIMFRAILQNLTMLPSYVFPILTEPLLMFNAGAFGAVHAMNNQAGAYIQSLAIALKCYTISYTRTYGTRNLAYTIGMHMANNLIAQGMIGVSKLYYGSEEKK